MISESGAVTCVVASSKSCSGSPCVAKAKLDIIGAKAQINTAFASWPVLIDVCCNLKTGL